MISSPNDADYYDDGGGDGDDEGDDGRDGGRTGGGFDVVTTLREMVTMMVRMRMRMS